MEKKIKKVVLAYSGGLDTSIIIPWLKEHYNNPEIIAVSGDVGQNDELEGLEEKAIKTGASKLYIADLTDEMVDEVIIPSLKMGASYEQYLLGTAFARPIIAKKLVEIAKAEGADAHMKSKLAVDFADLVYNGKWFTPLREALSAFADKTQEHVTGSVKLKLYKGNMITASITSPESLYSEELVTFNESSYDQTNATGFINLWGLPDTVLALREQGKL